MYDVIVIGGGPAGVTAALRSAELGASVALVERSRLGGTCTNDGCVPTRVLAKAARLLRNASQHADYGIVAEKPRLDFPALLSRTQEIVFRIHEKKQLISHLEGAGVDLYTESGEARFIDAHTIQVDHHPRLQAKKFIICAGGRARKLPLPGGQLAMTHSDIWSLDRLPEDIIIVGAAATGCQLASIFSDFGSKIRLLDIADHILPGEDEAVSREMDRCFRRQGIQITTGIDTLTGIKPAETGGRLELSYLHNGRQQRLSSQAVVLAVGWPGNVDGLNISAAGIQAEAGFIPVNDHLQTSQAHIFAAGDITGRMMLVQSAAYEARIAAENAVLEAGRRYGHQIVPHGGFTDPEYGSVGLTEVQARRRGEIAVATVPFGNLDRAVIDGQTSGFCKLIASRTDLRILGAHVVGEQAVEIVQMIATGMAAGLKVEQLAETELAYPTYTAIVGLAARQLVHQLDLAPLATQWRTLGRTASAEWERRDSG